MKQMAKRRTIHLRSTSFSRLVALLQAGDKARGFVFHKNIGSYVEMEIRAVAHWGINAVIRGEEAERLYKQFKKEHADEMVKRQYIVKWCNIEELHLQ